MLLGALGLLKMLMFLMVMMMRERPLPHRSWDPLPYLETSDLFSGVPHNIRIFSSSLQPTFSLFTQIFKRVFFWNFVQFLFFSQNIRTFSSSFLLCPTFPLFHFSSHHHHHPIIALHVWPSKFNLCRKRFFCPNYRPFALTSAQSGEKSLPVATFFTFSQTNLNNQLFSAQISNQTLRNTSLLKSRLGSGKRWVNFEEW